MACLQKPLRILDGNGFAPPSGSAGPSLVGGLWDAVVQTARAMITQASTPRFPGIGQDLHFIELLDTRTLADIGLEADAIRRDLPPRSWPN